MTHNQSFPGPLGLLVNIWVNQGLLANCMCSFVLLRSLHYIISLQKCHPSTKIFISKFDLDSAYSRCHLSRSTAHEYLSIHIDILLMTLRMTFWGSPCPSLWGYISDTTCDICNVIISNIHWDHKTTFDSFKLDFGTAKISSRIYSFPSSQRTIHGNSHKQHGENRHQYRRYYWNRTGYKWKQFVCQLHHSFSHPHSSKTILRFQSNPPKRHHFNEKIYSRMLNGGIKWLS